MRVHNIQAKLKPLAKPSEVSPQPVTHHIQAGQRLWLGLCFVDLPIEVLTRTGESSGSIVVIDPQQGQPLVAAVNAVARKQGISPGMRANSVCAIVPDVTLLQRDQPLEATSLASLAAWCGQFTSHATLVEPGGLLLEIGASLRLFGGFEKLLAGLCDGLQALGFSSQVGTAPTPLAAWLLACSGAPSPVFDPAHLAGALANIPIELMGLPTKAVAKLRHTGVKCFADCYRLPRDGLTRRIGPAVLDILDRALGKRPDPREPYIAPAFFERSLALPEHVESSATLLLAIERLLLELSGILQAGACGIESLEIHLAHRQVPATRVMIGLAVPSRDPEQLLMLVRERLQHLELTIAVEYVGIRVRHFVVLAPSNQDLFGQLHPLQGNVYALIERLSARLGSEAIHSLSLRDDHRPELASVYVPPASSGQCQARFTDWVSEASAATRPCWLLPCPQPLALHKHHPQLRGDLNRVQGPERIESGWWDGNDIARDYFIAENEQGERFWIFKDRRHPQRWYLHGIFA